MRTASIFLATALVGSTMAAVETLGCYKSSTGTTFKATDSFNSQGGCGTNCNGSAVFATQLMKCYCGDMLPPDSDKTDISNCDIKCPGYPLDNCGGKSYFFFYDAGLSSNIPIADHSDASSAGSSPASTTSAKPSVVTLGGQTVVVTSESNSSSKPNVAGIAAGVIVGVVVIAGSLGGLYMFMRNRKRRAIEEEHRRNAAINNFTKPPPSSGSNSFQDTRLDPVMAQRRMSDGSIADNQDYSRKILKVTNA